MRNRLLPLAVLAGVLALGGSTALPGEADAIELYSSEDGQTSFSIGGYTQPYYRWVQNPCSYTATNLPPEPCVESTVPDGFGLTRTRLSISGTQWGTTDYKIELRTVPNVELLEARVTFEAAEWLHIRAGRFKVPFSRQELTSESRLQLIDRASFIKSTPGRQLGAALMFDTNFGASSLADDFLSFDIGVFNGESAKERAPINNIDEDFLYGGRLEISPFGAPESFAEGDLRTAEERRSPLLSIGANYTFETRGPENGDFEQRRLGGDLLFAWHGVFLYSEFYRYDRDYARDETSADRSGQGWNVQAGTFIPAPYLRDHLEIAGRVEEWDPEIARKDEREAELLSPVPGSGPARPNGSTQAHRNYVAGLNWYFQGHDLKLQANYTHRQEIEDWQLSANEDEVPQGVDDDTFFLQLTYRF